MGGGGSVVFDPFCGCATTLVAAQQLGRKWIGIDTSEKAAELVAERLKTDSGLFTDFIHRTDIPVRSDVKVEPPTKDMQSRLYGEQREKCNACELYLPLVNLTLDHIIPKSKGGGDYYENCQLLCGHCNSVKGDRPMDYLMDKIRKRKQLKLKVTFV